MNKIILFFYFCIVSYVKCDIHSRFKIQYFENNITIHEVYYQDNNLYNEMNAKHVLLIYVNNITDIMHAICHIYQMMIYYCIINYIIENHYKYLISIIIFRFYILLLREKFPIF